MTAALDSADRFADWCARRSYAFSEWLFPSPMLGPRPPTGAEREAVAAAATAALLRNLQLAHNRAWANNEWRKAERIGRTLEELRVEESTRAARRGDCSCGHHIAWHRLENIFTGSSCEVSGCVCKHYSGRL